MSISAVTSLLAQTNGLDILAQVSAQSAQSQNNIELNIISQQLTNQLNTKIAAIQNQQDQSGVTVLQSQITPLNQQLTIYQKLAPQYSQNAGILADLNNALDALTTAANAGDSAGFDAALSQAQNSLSILTPTQPVGTLQPDGIAPFQANGLGIQSSATYGLSTPTGQAAALQDIQNAQNAFNSVLTATTTDQTVTGATEDALNAQIQGLTTQLNNLQFDQLQSGTTQVLTLKQNSATELHLIELQLGRTSQATNVLTAFRQQEQQATQTAGTIFALFA